MKDITIILPIHKIENDNEFQLLDSALNSVVKCKENYNHKLIVSVIGPKEIENKIQHIVEKTLGGTEVEYNFITNKTGQCDFASQVNLAATKVNTDFFSILEFDDEYMPKWFKLAETYYPTREDVSLFLPIAVQNDGKFSSYVNELVWAMAFSNEVGVIDSDCLQNTTAFNLTGGIFNTRDFNLIGGFNAEIPVAFNYEFLFRLINDYKLKSFVVPRMGYGHMIGRKGSLLDVYKDTYDNQQVTEFFRSVKEKYAPIEEEQAK